MTCNDSFWCVLFSAALHNSHTYDLTARPLYWRRRLAEAAGGAAAAVAAAPSDLLQRTVAAPELTLLLPVVLAHCPQIRVRDAAAALLREARVAPAALEVSGNADAAHSQNWAAFHFWVVVWHQHLMLLIWPSGWTLMEP
jgi:hypothetical protein